MKRSIGFYSLVTALAFVFLFGSNGPAHTQVREIRIADSKGDWGYPNPYRHYPRGPGYVRMSWVFDTLIWKDREGYVPALADEWAYDPEESAFTFRLNEAAKWHDGSQLTAADVVFTIDYFKKHPYRWITVDHIDRAEAESKHTVTIYLAEPYSPFLADIGGTMPVLPKHIWENVSDPIKYSDPEAFIGSGPYVFRDFNSTQGTYLFEAFDDYYQGRPKVDRLIYVRSGNPVVSLTSGQVDLSMISPEMADRLEAAGMVIIADEAGWNKKLMINHRREPLKDRAFRRAMAYAIDRREIIDKSHRGFGRVASYGLLSVDHEMYNPETPDYPHDPGKARGLIESLGYEEGPGGFYLKNGRPLRIELIASSLNVAGQSVPDRDGEVIRRQLESAGIRVDLVTLESVTADSRVKAWDFDLAISGHGGIGGDPRILNEMISSHYGAGSVNSARYDANQELNDLLEAQIAEMDEAKRKELVFRIQEIHAKDLPAISLYHPDGMAAYNPEKGVEWFFTRGGISKGIPIPQNKMSLLR